MKTYFIIVQEQNFVKRMLKSAFELIRIIDPKSYFSLSGLSVTSFHVHCNCNLLPPSSYQRTWKQYVKLKHLLANKPKITHDDKQKLKLKEERLQEMKLKE